MTTPIKIWYHVTLRGAFEKITLTIFDEIERSGLYDACQSISVGVLGAASEMPKLTGILERYTKSKIVAYNSNPQYFEFHTLQHLKSDADTLPKFYALYLHSKGITSENENDAKFRQFWCDYMMNFLVTDWKKCYHALDLKDLDDHDCGYDLAAVRIVAARKSINKLLHASGNFWWANSEYIQTLPLALAETYFDGQNPYHGGHYPEMWVWQGQPIAYMPVNLFQMGFPYDQGTFKEYWEALPNKEKYLL